VDRQGGKISKLGNWQMRESGNGIVGEIDLFCLLATSD